MLRSPCIAAAPRTGLLCMEWSAAAPVSCRAIDPASVRRSTSMTAAGWCSDSLRARCSRVRRRTWMPSSLTMVVSACPMLVYLEGPRGRFLMGSSCTWNLILMTSKGPTMNRAMHPDRAPAVASSVTLLFFFCPDDSMCMLARLHSSVEVERCRLVARLTPRKRVAPMQDGFSS